MCLGIARLHGRCMSLNLMPKFCHHRGQLPIPSGLVPHSTRLTLLQSCFSRHLWRSQSHQGKLGYPGFD